MGTKFNSKILAIVSGWLMLLCANSALAQNMNVLPGTCPWCGVMDWSGVVLSSLLVLMAVATIAILTLFLFLRSRPPETR
ncbi:MAG: hypothetical protein ACXVA9_06265 [Bdellovibrionales bacterium]